MKPTIGQEAAISGVLGAVASPSASQAVLAGYAGTGKTTTLGWIVARLRAAGKRIVVSAHTRKALGEARARLSGAVETMTVYQALGWTIDPRTQETMRRGPIRFGAADVLIVDEASMIDVDMYDAIVRGALSCGAFVLWVGDPAQLPPITPTGSTRMPAFELVEHRFTLTEIMRQAGDSDIVSASMYLRECLEQRRRPCIDELATHVDDGSITVIDGGVHRAVDFATSAISHGLDARVVAWTNAGVNRAAGLIGAHFHPPGADRLVAGDPVTFARRYREAAETDAIGVVTAVSEPTPHGPLGVTCLRVSVQMGADVVDAWTPEDLDAYHHQRRRLVWEQSEARRARAYGSVRQIGAAIQEMDDAYADIRQQYALTAHKSQGSTFDVAVLDWADISRCADAEMLCRILYVACTRPSQYLVLVK